MMRSNGSAVLLDFGAGKIGTKRLSVADAQKNREKHTQHIIMTQGWSCHHHRKMVISPECDLFALGRIMFYLITG